MSDEQPQVTPTVYETLEAHLESPVNLLTFDERLAQVRARKSGGGRGRRSSRQRVGCLISYLSVVAVTLALVVLAVFLPPLDEYNPIINALEENPRSEFIRLTSEDRMAEKDGLRVEVLPSDPGQEFEVSLQHATVEDYLAGKLSQCVPATTLPPFITPVDAVYSLETQGTAPQRIGLNVPVSGQQHDLYGWFGEAWHFIPSQLAADGEQLVTDVAQLPDCLAVMSVLPTLPTLATDAQIVDSQLAELVTQVYVTGLHPAPDATLQGSLPMIQTANPGYRQLILLQNFNDPAVVDSYSVEVILSQPALRQAHAQAIAEAAEDYDGVVLDYRDIRPDLRDQFSDFVNQLATQTDLMVVVPSATFANGWVTGAYDWRSLGLLADEMIIRLPLDPRTYLPDGEVEAMLTWAVGEINRNQLSIAFSALAVDDVQDSPLRLVALDGTNNENLTSNTLPAPYSIQFDVNTLLQMPVVSFFEEDTLLRTIWITTPETIEQHLQWVDTFQLGGVWLMDLSQIELETKLVELLQTFSQP